MMKFFTIQENDAGTEAFTDEYVKSLETDLAEMKRKYGFTYCAYCGKTYEIDAPESVDAISLHITTCKKHPMRQVECELAEAKNALREIQKHHFQQNRLKGRNPMDSRTLTLCAKGLGLDGIAKLSKVKK